MIGKLQVNRSQQQEGRRREELFNYIQHLRSNDSERDRDREVSSSVARERERGREED